MASDWDDSALIHAFNSAMSKYQEMHGQTGQERKAGKNAVITDAATEDVLVAQDEAEKLEFDDAEVAERDLDNEALPSSTAWEESLEGEPAAANQQYDHASQPAAKGYPDQADAEQYSALQQMYYQLHQLEQQQKQLKQQLVAWIRWHGGHPGATNAAHSVHLPGGYCNFSSPVPMPHVYPCYCQYHCPTLSCRASCGLPGPRPVCVVHSQPCFSQPHGYCSCQQARYLGQPLYQQCFGACHHVCKTWQDPGPSTADEAERNKG